jgi:hypothetical protein
MAVPNTLAYYDTATIMAVKSFELRPKCFVFPSTVATNLKTQQTAISDSVCRSCKRTLALFPEKNERRHRFSFDVC